MDMLKELPIPWVAKVVASVSLVGLFAFLLRLYNALLLKPNRLRSMLKKQGIDGPPPSFLFGNIMEMNKARQRTIDKSPAGQPPTSHNCAAILFPFFNKWAEQYGRMFMFSLGNIQILYVTRPDLVREVTTCTSLHFGKPSYQQNNLAPLVGRGIISSNGALWAHQRKVIAPELYMDKVKGMVGHITDSANTLVNSWNKRIEGEDGLVADIKIDQDMRHFSGDVISRACFGSNYMRGQEILSKLRILQETIGKKRLPIRIPGMRYVPTESNRKTWAVEKEVRRSILKTVKERQEASHQEDLLQMILQAAANSNLNEDDMDRFIVDNCKNIYLAGYEATAISSIWMLMLLASHQEWQDRFRAEVDHICKGQRPDFDMLRGMKQSTMVIQETLRLYSPVTVISREAYKDMRIGDIEVPKGLNVWTLAMQLHTDPEIWGPDSYEFKPQRFENGIAGACKFPHVYMPFGVGPRVCLGQNLAMLELKLLLALAVSNFSFSISPNYIHSPVLRLVIEPQYGVRLLVKKL